MLQNNIDLKGKTILVTGSAGFIGSNLVLRLLKAFSPINIVGLDSVNDYYDVRLKEYRLSEIDRCVSEHPESKYTFIKGNLADKDLIDSLFSMHHFDIVVNLAAQAGVRYSIENPGAYIESNLIGFYNILEACRHSVEASPKSSPKGKDLGVHTADPMWYDMLKSFAEENRKSPTEAENVLWNALKAKGIGFKFRQQHIIEDFIVDFYCNEKKLTIELDGGYHKVPEQMKSDAERTARLKELGYTELRFTNEQVVCDLDNILSEIKRVCQSIKTHPIGENENDSPSLQGGVGEGSYQGVQHLVYASSSSVYGGNKKVPFAETDMVDNPVSLYAATKKSNELLAHSYSKLYSIPSTGLRFFTVYGPAGRPDMAYFGFTNKLIKGDKIQIFNYGNCKRDFTYVDDIVEGVVRVMQHAPEVSPKRGDLEGSVPYKVYNIGNSNPENLLDFVQILQEELVRANVLPNDYDFESHKELVPMQAGDVPVTYADTSSLEADFGFKPHTSLREGLRHFAEWYSKFYLKKVVELNLL